jgi:hypothetical protein
VSLMRCPDLWSWNSADLCINSAGFKKPSDRYFRTA